MDLNLNLSLKKNEPIEDTLPVPVSKRLKSEIDQLKKICGKEVNEKAREFLESLVKQNRDKFGKAG